ncbi:MAG: GTPase Era [Deltaproteobacteria bacterium]|nr:GTPase Era [Deltaproteobacteria bacterium]
MQTFKSGFISILGRPNVGKSTLFNRIIGEKIAIVTARPQTTRNRILGIKNVEEGQLIFLDTPGLHEGRSELNRRMVQTAMASSWEADILLILIEAISPPVEEDRKMITSLKENKGIPFLIINKIDLVRKERLLPLMDQYQKIHPFEKIIPISAITGEGVDILLEEVLRVLPESPPYYPDEIFTDQTERSIVSEMIREKVIDQTYQEVPHSSAVTIESFKEHPERNLVVIHGTIHVEKDSQKKILIGKGGQRLKKIGETARKEIEAFLGRRVFLELWVKVERDWTRDPHALDELGYSLR